MCSGCVRTAGSGCLLSARPSNSNSFRETNTTSLRFSLVAQALSLALCGRPEWRPTSSKIGLTGS